MAQKSFCVGGFYQTLVVALDDVGAVAGPRRGFAFVLEMGKVVIEGGMMIVEWFLLHLHGTLRVLADAVNNQELLGKTPDNS
jgi:hypothetical protein